MRVLSFNTWGIHGPARRRPVLEQAVRALGANLLCLQEAADLAQPDRPTRLLAPESGLAILSRFPAASHRTITYETRSPLEPYRRIDYLFLRASATALKPITCQVVCSEPDESGMYPSDHYGVLATLAHG